MERTRGSKMAIGFMIVWLVFWTAGILIVLWGIGTALFHGELMMMLFLALWLAAAIFGLYSGAKKLRHLLLVGREPPRPVRNHEWKDLPPDSDSL